MKVARRSRKMCDEHFIGLGDRHSNADRFENCTICRTSRNIGNDSVIKRVSLQIAGFAASQRRTSVKASIIALAAGFAALSAATMTTAITTSTSVEALTANQATKNRLDPNRITSKRVQRHDYGARRYRWADGDDYRYRRYRGWYRYDDRPYGWRDRDCVGVGPVWFCP